MYLAIQEYYQSFNGFTLYLGWNKEKTALSIYRDDGEIMPIVDLDMDNHFGVFTLILARFSLNNKAESEILANSILSKLWNKRRKSNYKLKNIKSLESISEAETPLGVYMEYIDKNTYLTIRQDNESYAILSFDPDGLIKILGSFLKQDPSRNQVFNAFILSSIQNFLTFQKEKKILNVSEIINYFSQLTRPKKIAKNVIQNLKGELDTLLDRLSGKS